MFKFTQNTDFDFGVESVSIITDSKSLTKRASAKHLLKYEKTAGQTDVHVIAVGAYEGTGWNRNGDCFLERDCEKNAHYFKDAGRALHRHHKNKPSDPKFGNIKAAAFNAEMKRIELIVGHDNDKCADILTEIEKKGQANYSMASKQKYDICSWCKHEAFSDNDRCSHIPHKIGEINKHGEMCGMINPDPHWFEISYVRRPADRIGMSLAKMAGDSVRPMLPSDYLKLYDGFVPPEGDMLISKKASDKRTLLKKLSEMEKHLDMVATNTINDKYLKNELPKINLESKIASDLMDEIRNLDPAKVFKYAAERGVIFSPENFVRYVFGERIKQASIDSMKTHLADIYTQLEKDASDVVNNEKYEPALFGTLDYDGRKALDKVASETGLTAERAKNRVVMMTLLGKTAEQLKSSQEITRSKDVVDLELAKQYAAYKLAALTHIDLQDKLDDAIIWNALIQNR